MGAVASYIIGEEASKKYIVKQDSENLWSIANVVDPEIETADTEELITEFTHEIVHDDLADFVDISIQVSTNCYPYNKPPILRVALIRITEEEIICDISVKELATIFQLVHV